MGLFQSTIQNKYLKGAEEDISALYRLFTSYFHNPAIQENIRNSKEEQFQEGFLRELFVKILGYTLNPEPNYNLTTEQKNQNDARKADGSIIVKGEVTGIIELKDTKTTDLKQVETQAFGYKNNHRKASYVVISNFEKLRFYIDNAIDFFEHSLTEIKEITFDGLRMSGGYLLYSAPNLQNTYIYKVSKENQEQFVPLAKNRAKFSINLQTKRQRFLQRLTDNLGSIKITGTLERFEELEFAQFLAELKKQKIALSLKQQDEWNEYFNPTCRP